MTSIFARLKQALAPRRCRRTEYVVLIAPASALALKIAGKVRRWSRTIFLCLEDGPLSINFRNCADVFICSVQTASEDETHHLIADVFRGRRIKYAIASGSESIQLALALECRCVPIVLLVNEPLDTGRPRAFWEDVFNQISVIVFASEAIRESYLRDIGVLARRKSHLFSCGWDIDILTASLDRLGVAAALDVQTRAADRAIIEQSADFDGEFYCGRELAKDEHTFALNFYMKSTKNFYEQNSFAPFRYTQRPCPGFNPYRFLLENPTGRTGYQDPLAEYIRSGRPAGPWTREVFGAPCDSSSNPKSIRVAVHGHFYYPELFVDFFSRFMRNKIQSDLYITTSTIAGKHEIESIARSNGRLAHVLVVPNQGRNIGPLITTLGPMIAAHYDIIAHIHGKRSVEHQSVGSAGDSWRTFLWEHLIGGRYPMLDHLVSILSDQKDIGLLYPEDRDLPGWDTNATTAGELAIEMGIHVPLPQIIDFPIGNMFLARVDALKPLFDLGLTYKDYPPEPLGYDGTILHALERLLPMIAESRGFRSAAVHLPHIFR